MNTKQKKIDLMKRWIAALRSGEYKQGTGNLYRDCKYCCLGVLCDISPSFRKGEEGFFSRNNRHFMEYLPKSLSKPLGLDSRDSKGNSVQHRLIDMNDGGVFERTNRKSFKQIASYIEKNILPILEQE